MQCDLLRVLVFVSSGGLLTSFPGDMAMGKVDTLFRCRRIPDKALGSIPSTDRGALLLLTASIPLLEATGQTTTTTTTMSTADPWRRPGHSSPETATRGHHFTSPAQPPRVRSSWSSNQAGSRTRRDLTVRYPLPSVQESEHTLGSATVMYVTLSFDLV